RSVLFEIVLERRGEALVAQIGNHVGGALLIDVPDGYLDNWANGGICPRYKVCHAARARDEQFSRVLTRKVERRECRGTTVRLRGRAVQYPSASPSFLAGGGKIFAPSCPISTLKGWIELAFNIGFVKLFYEPDVLLVDFREVDHN